MILCYQVATPDVAIADSVTAYQGSLEKTFGDLSRLGYSGVELMTLDPDALGWPQVRETAEKYNLSVVLMCTGEIYGQLGLTFTDPDSAIREQAVARVKRVIEFAAYLGANVNIGRVRGQYRLDVPTDSTWQWAVDAFRILSDHAQPLGVQIALETVTIMQTNFINTLEEGVQMMKAVNRPNFKLMMDVFHMNIEEPEVIAAIERYSPYNIHVHLADNNRRYPGQCGLDFRNILETFHRCGYTGAFCTEIFQMPDMETAARESFRCLKPLLDDIYGQE